MKIEIILDHLCTTASVFVFSIFKIEKGFFCFVFYFEFFQFNFFATSAISMPHMHSVCHFKFFCYCDDGRDNFKNDFKKSRIDLRAKLV